MLRVTAQQAAQRITLLPLITHPAFCTLRLDDDRIRSALDMEQSRITFF
ncbi:hypothetical protein ECN1_0207 [Escherichia coli N1]|nr:hypothetical protein ECN1_0207 [Escherichia coli N1]